MAHPVPDHAALDHHPCRFLLTSRHARGEWATWLADSPASACCEDRAARRTDPLPDCAPRECGEPAEIASREYGVSRLSPDACLRNLGIEVPAGFSDRRKAAWAVAQRAGHQGGRNYQRLKGHRPCAGQMRN